MILRRNKLYHGHPLSSGTRRKCLMILSICGRSFHVWHCLPKQGGGRVKQWHGNSVWTGILISLTCPHYAHGTKSFLVLISLWRLHASLGWLGVCMSWPGISMIYRHGIHHSIICVICSQGSADLVFAWVGCGFLWCVICKQSSADPVCAWVGCGFLWCHLWTHDT